MTLDAGDGGRQLLPLRRFVVESHPQLDRMIGTSRKLMMEAYSRGPYKRALLYHHIYRKKSISSGRHKKQLGRMMDNCREARFC